MSKKKLCGNYSGCAYAGKSNPSHNEFYYCPENVNSKCEIIPKKPKTKTFKGWAFKDENGNIAAFNKKAGKPFFPCTITIATKYLKEGK